MAFQILLSDQKIAVTFVYTVKVGGNAHTVGNHVPLDVGKNMLGIVRTLQSKRLEADGTKIRGCLRVIQMPLGVRELKQTCQKPR